MIQASIRDFPAGQSWNLSSLLMNQESRQVTIGRVNFGDDIELGQGLSLFSLAGKTKQEQNKILDHLEKLFQVLRTHATINYQNHGWNGEGFYISNNSRVPILVGDEYLHLENGKMALKGRTDLYFGLYGPVVFEAPKRA